MPPYGQDPTCFLEGGFPPSCFRCSAEKVSSAFNGEHDDAEDRYVTESYHMEHAGSAVTARVTYQQGNYGTKFVGVSMDRSCCAPKATIQGADETRLVTDVEKSRYRYSRLNLLFARYPLIVPSPLNSPARAEVTKNRPVSLIVRLS